MTFNEVLANEEFRSSFGNDSEAYVKGAETMISAAEIGEMEIPIKGKGWHKDKEERKKILEFDQRMMNGSISKHFSEDDGNTEVMPYLGNIFWLAWARIPGWQVFLTVVCGMIIWLYDQAWWVYLTWIIPGIGACGYYLGAGFRCLIHAERVASGKKIRPTSKVNVYISIGAVVLAILMNIGLQVDEVDSGLNTAMRLYLQSQQDVPASMSNAFESDPSYYSVSKGAELLDNGHYSAVVKISMPKVFRILFSNDQFCSSAGVFETCAELMEESGYSDIKEVVAAAMRESGLETTQKLKLEYSVEDLGDGDIYVTLEDYTEY